MSAENEMCMPDSEMTRIVLKEEDCVKEENKAALKEEVCVKEEDKDKEDTCGENDYLVICDEADDDIGEKSEDRKDKEDTYGENDCVLICDEADDDVGENSEDKEDKEDTYGDDDGEGGGKSNPDYEIIADTNKYMQKMLHSEVKLSDGSIAKMFSRGPKYSEELWPISCHICLVGNIHKKRGLRKHIQSKRHTKMVKLPPPDPLTYKRAFRQPIGRDAAIVTPLRIFPGEIITDITPELQHRIIRRDDWNYKELEKDKISRLRDFVAEHSRKATMMGLCYAFKMKRFAKIMYYCALCRTHIRGEGYQHFVGSRHVDKYIEKHFPNSCKKLEVIFEGLRPSSGHSMGPKRRKYIRWIFDRIYTKIEKQKGSRQAKLVDSHNFKINRSQYAKIADDSEHYDENTISISDAELEKYAQRALATKSLDEPTLSTEKHRKVAKLPTDEKEKESTTATDDKTIKKTTVPETRAGKDRRESKLFADSPLVWDRYSRMIGATLDDTEDQYERYEIDPESHPRYELEWKKFWHMRADELEKDNIDPHTYDFNAEWMPFWIRRLQEFHAKDIVKSKFDTKRKLNLSYDARSPSPVRRQKRTCKSRSLSPRRVIKRSRDQRENRMSPRKQQIYSHDEPLTIVSVMRLVSALEDQLGSLGPRAVELLSRAILSEKNNPTSSDLLMENDFYVFFMTAKEKLKGQIMAGIVEPNKINAVNQTINRITPMVDMIEDYRARNGGGRHSNRFPGNDGNLYDAINQFNNNAGPPNKQYPNQYSGGNQGGIWQSGAYCADKSANSRANYQSMASISNYRGGNNSDHYQSGVGGVLQHYPGDNYFNQSNRMNGLNINGGSNRAVRMSRPNIANPINNAEKEFIRRGNFSGRGNQMDNSGGRHIGGGYDSNQSNTGYNHPNNFNNTGEQPVGMQFDMVNDLLFSLNNSNARASAMPMDQNSMGNYGGFVGYNNRSNKMNYQQNRNNNNSGRFQN